ncbi:MAG: ribonuclease R [Helicobacteraceae bacterium]|jgi:ribonuclease R|nr:ribonuclease R [Helicobacteraceae bacterium]
MKGLLLKLKSGIAQDSLSKKELKQVHELIKANLLKDREILKFDADIVFGYYLQPKTLKKGKKSVGYLQPLGIRNHDLLIQPGDNNNASDHDLVIARIIGNRRGRLAAKIVHIAEENQSVQIGYISIVNNRAEVLSIDSSLPMSVNIKQRSLKALNDGTVFTIDKNAELDELLGMLNDPKVDESIVLTKYGRADHFDSELISEAKSYGEIVDKTVYPDHIDLTHLPFITIDPIDAKDYDDAIYFDRANSTLYVAIADVTSYVAEHGAIDKEAKKRGFSIYLPHKSIPMLPRELSENLCSLQPNTDRLAFTFKIELDDHLKVKKYELLESVIHSVHRYHYDRIDELLNGATQSAIDTEIMKWLTPLKELVIKLRDKRLKKGFNFFNPEIKLHLDKNLKLIASQKAIETISHQLIEECMLLANCSAAEYFTFGIFRTHEAPNDKNIRELLSALSELGITVKSGRSIHQTIEKIQQEADKYNIRETVDRLLIRSLKKAQYTYNNIGHFGLGFDKYTHFTSPIRRYSDLILHRLLKSILQKNDKLKEHIVHTMQSASQEITILETETSQIEWQYADRVYARWASEHISLVLTAEVIEEAHGGKEAVAIVCDHDIAQGMRIYLINSYKQTKYVQRFSKVQVAIANANIATARISATLV